jgi:hypothetical protein
MSYKLTNRDYIQLLNFYQVEIPKNKQKLREVAEKLMAQKLCSCIKKVAPTVEIEPLAIGACTRTIFTRKNLRRNKFQCKKRRYLKFTKRNKTALKIKRKTLL